MKIAIAVDGSVRDRAVLAWAASFARPGDDLHVVHAYQELSLHGSAWLPAVRANDHRRHRARSVLSSAQSVLLAALQRDRQIAVGGSALVGWPHQVLADISAVADLLVVGSRPGPGPACLIDASCPVVVVPAEWTIARARGRSVGVVCHAELSTAAMDRAVEYACRAGMSVLVLQSHDDGRHSAARLSEAGQLERLDLQVAGWQRVGGPPIVAEVRPDGPVEAVRSAAAVLALLVVDAGSEQQAISRLAVDELHLPVFIVEPDGRAQRAPVTGPALAEIV